LKEDAFEKAHPNSPAAVCWAIRFDDAAHAKASIIHCLIPNPNLNPNPNQTSFFIYAMVDVHLP
jgi:hypothetical protein